MRQATLQKYMAASGKQKIAKQAFSTYEFELSGNKNFLRMLVELPILSMITIDGELDVKPEMQQLLDLLRR